MKSIVNLIFLFLVSSSICYSQVDLAELPYKDDNVVYEKVFEFKGSNKDNLYRFSKRWFVKSFVNSKEVLRTDNQLDGELIGVGISSFKAPKKGIWWVPEISVESTFMINVKNEKLRIRIFDINRVYVSSEIQREKIEILDFKRRKSRSKLEREQWNETVKLLNSSVDKIFEDFKSSLKEDLNDEF